MTIRSTAIPGAGGSGWLTVAVLVGAVYLLIGRLFALPAEHVQAWRRAAWLLSGVVYASHAGWEQFGRRSSPRGTASHVALAVAVGALGLALVGLVRASGTAAGVRPAWLVALVAWPAITAVPAWIVTLALAALLGRLGARRSR